MNTQVEKSIRAAEVFTEMEIQESHYKRAFETLRALDRKFEDKELRYHRALQSHSEAAELSLQFQLAMMDGLRSKYHEYAVMKMQQISVLRLQLADILQELH